MRCFCSIHLAALVPVGVALTAIGTQGLEISDGFSSSGTAGSSSPIDGTIMTMSSIDTSSSGCSFDCFKGAVTLGDYVWLIPDRANYVLKVHKVTGAIVQYNALASGMTSGSGSTKFRGGVLDQATGKIWMVPHHASHLASIDTADGTVAFCASSWPSGITGHTYGAMTGAFLIPSTNNLWMAPYRANMVIHADVSNCATTGYNTWNGVSIGTFAFGGMVYDSVHQLGWMIPYEADHVTKVSTNSGPLGPGGTLGTISGFNSWPTGLSNQQFRGGALIGTNLWMAPFGSGGAVVRLDTVWATQGTMVKYESWPTGFTLGSQGFWTAATDGQYFWMLPRTASHMVRVDPAAGSMMKFDKPSTYSGFSQGQSLVIDSAASTMWLAPMDSPSDKLLKLTFTKPTPTATLPPPLPQTRTMTHPVTSAATSAVSSAAASTVGTAAATSTASGGAMTTAASGSTAAAAFTTSAGTTAVAGTTAGSTTSTTASAGGATTTASATSAVTTAAAATTTATPTTTAAASSTFSATGSFFGNGASSLTAAALGFVTMVLAMF